MRNLIVGLLCAGAALASGGFAPPVETLDRIASGWRSLESDGFVGSYTVSSEVEIATMKGTVKHSELVVERVSRSDDGVAERHVISARRDGVDATAEVRAERSTTEASGGESGGEDEGSKSLSVTVRPPSSDDLAAYRFSEPRPCDGGLVSAFEPAGAETKTGGSGHLAWDPESLDPLWIELSPAENPKHVKSMTLRLEFERAGDHLYACRTHTQAVGGFLFFKRRFTADITVTDVTFESP